MPASAPSYTLGPYIVDVHCRSVTRDGVPLKLARRHFDALQLLVEADRQIVSKEQFLRHLWPEATVVDESNLTQCISQLRKALGNGDNIAFVETVPRIGYRLLLPATRVDAPAGDEVPVAEPSESAAGASRLPRRLLIAAVAVVALVAAGIGAAQWWQTRPAHLSRAAQDRGNEFTRRGEFKAAAEEFQRAVQLDPRNATAYAELAFALNRLSFRNSVATPVGQSPSVIAAARAVDIDPRCGGCQGAYAFFLFYHDWRWTTAEEHFERALQLAPDRRSIRPAYAMLLAATGRRQEALEHIELALAAQPLEVGWHTIRAAILYLDRRYEDSIAAGDRAMAITQDERGPWEWRSKALFQLGRRDEAVKALAQVAFAEHSRQLDAVVRDGGSDAGLRTLLEVTGDWRSQREQSWRRAPWRALLDDSEGALTELETAYELRNVNLLYIGTDPVFDKIRDHPRFQRILRGMGLRVGITRD
jgi:DNA-binding winged helix-turn-helix (wHTH) protein/Flp pilus assembly protein TadD